MYVCTEMTCACNGGQVNRESENRTQPNLNSVAEL